MDLPRVEITAAEEAAGNDVAQDCEKMLQMLGLLVHIARKLDLFLMLFGLKVEKPLNQKKVAIAVRAHERFSQ